MNLNLDWNWDLILPVAVLLLSGALVGYFLGKWHQRRRTNSVSTRGSHDDATQMSKRPSYAKRNQLSPIGMLADLNGKIGLHKAAALIWLSAWIAMIWVLLFADWSWTPLTWLRDQVEHDPALGFRGAEFVPLLAASLLAFLPAWLVLRFMSGASRFRSELRANLQGTVLLMLVLVAILQGVLYLLKVQELEHLSWVTEDWQLLAIGGFASGLLTWWFSTIIKHSKHGPSTV